MPGFGCQNAGVSGFPSSQCACERPIPEACRGIEIPQTLIGRKVRACGLIARAGVSKSEKRLLLGAAKRLGKAARVADRAARQGKLPEACADAFAAQLRDAKARAELLAGTL